MDSDAEDSEDEDEDMSEGELRKRAIGEIEEEVEGSSEDSDAESEDSEAMETNFHESAKGPKQSKLSQAKGIASLKFMKRGELKVKEQLKEQAKMLIQQLKEEQELLDESDEEKKDKPVFLKGNASKFSKQALDVADVKESSYAEADLQKAAKLLTTTKANGKDLDVEDSNVKTNKKTQEAKVKPSKTKKVEVTFDAATDLKGVKTDSKKVISIAKDD